MVADGLHRRAKGSDILEYILFTHFVSTEHWDVNAKDSYKEFIHAPQLVPTDAVYSFLWPKYCF